MQKKLFDRSIRLLLLSREAHVPFVQVVPIPSTCFACFCGTNQFVAVTLLSLRCQSTIPTEEVLDRVEAKVEKQVPSAPSSVLLLLLLLCYTYLPIYIVFSKKQALFVLINSKKKFATIIGKSLQSYQKWALNQRQNQVFCFYIFVNLTRKRLMRSQTIARTKSYLPHTFSFPTDSCGRTCALLKSVEKILEDLISEFVVKSCNFFSTDFKSAHVLPQRSVGTEKMCNRQVFLQAVSRELLGCSRVKSMKI